MTANVFDYLEDPQASGESDFGACWAARTPRRPGGGDIRLIPRSPDWQKDHRSLATLGKLEAEPWVQAVLRGGEFVELRLRDAWIEAVGSALEAGGNAEAGLGDIAEGQRYAVQFWDANATKALHVGHLRNLAIGNALAAALTQAGAQVERRSLISDAGRSMGEAMAGVVGTGPRRPWFDGDTKSDHFVGICYADYVAASRPTGEIEIEHPEDSLTRELTMRDDAADVLLRRVLSGDSEALELWYKTRAWVIAGQRKTLARLGISFDRVFFESDFLAEAAELTASGLQDGQMRRRDDGVIVYTTGLSDFAEFPLVRPDGVPTQHMRSLAYWMSAPELDGAISMQICGTEWVSHVTCRRKLMAELLSGDGDGGMHPTHDIFNGMVAKQKRALASSEGALLIDDLTDALSKHIEEDPVRREIFRRHPAPERLAAQIALGYFLPHPMRPRIDFDADELLCERESLGWELVRARAHRSGSTAPAGKPADDPQYRFAVLQSELYKRHLRLAVERLDLRPLARYLRHLARWHLEADRGEHVDHVVQTLLDRSARGLGLEGTR